MRSCTEPVKTRLISLEAALTILKLSIALYPPCAWLRKESASENEEATTVDNEAEESWTIRNGLSQWAWRAIAELREEGEETSKYLALSIQYELVLTLRRPSRVLYGCAALRGEMSASIHSPLRHRPLESLPGSRSPAHPG